MNSPDLAKKRRRAVRKTKNKGIEKEEAFRYIRDNYSIDFEGHHLKATIENVYD